MIGEHMTCFGIGRNIGGVIVVSGNSPRIDEEDRLFDASGFQGFDQQFRAFVRFQKGASAARGIIETEGYALVRYRNRNRLCHGPDCAVCRSPESEQQNRQQDRRQEQARRQR